VNSGRKTPALGDILQSIGRIAKGSKLTPHDRIWNRESIASLDIDVFENQRQEPSHVLRLDGMTLADLGQRPGAERRNDGLYEPYKGRPEEEGTLSYREI
jgi:hypothetical protein